MTQELGSGNRLTVLGGLKPFIGSNFHAVWASLVSTLFLTNFS